MAQLGIFLQVNYEEKWAAAGKPRWLLWAKGPNRYPTARLIDRPIRPMFAEGQQQNKWSTRSFLMKNASALMAFGSSLALLNLTDIPFDADQSLLRWPNTLINPTQEQAEHRFNDKLQELNTY